MVRPSLQQADWKMTIVSSAAGQDCWAIPASDGPGPDTIKVNGIERGFFDYLRRSVPYRPNDGTLAPRTGRFDGRELPHGAGYGEWGETALISSETYGEWVFVGGGYDTAMVTLASALAI